MVMHGDWDWPGLYEDWQHRQVDYDAAQKALDDAMTQFLEAKGQAPQREDMQRVAALRGRMQEAREALNCFIAQHAREHREKHNLPHHGG